MSNQLKEYILITGAAGFIGAALSKKLLLKRYNVIGLDNLNDYYDVNLKKDRIKNLRSTSEELNCNDNWKFYKCDIKQTSRFVTILWC